MSLHSPSSSRRDRIDIELVLKRWKLRTAQVFCIDICNLLKAQNVQKKYYATWNLFLNKVDIYFNVFPHVKKNWILGYVNAGTFVVAMQGGWWWVIAKTCEEIFEQHEFSAVVDANAHTQFLQLSMLSCFASLISTIVSYCHINTELGGGAAVIPWNCPIGITKSSERKEWCFGELEAEMKCSLEVMKNSFNSLEMNIS